MTTRLPLRVEPMPGEWWRSYLLRVAATYGVHPFNVLGRIHGIESVDRRHLRWSGIAMSDVTAKLVGPIVNLDPGEIQAMHLSVYDGSVLTFTGRSHEDLDPAKASTVDRLLLGDAGPLVKVTSDRFCRRCVNRAPDYRATSWRLLLHLVCTRHHLLLTDPAGVGKHIAIDDTVVDSQREVLGRLSPSDANADFWLSRHGGCPEFRGTSVAVR